MFKTGRVWVFNTDRFKITLDIELDYGYVYDGDDPDGEVQQKLNDGDYVAFDSIVTVYCDDMEIASDSLGGSVYAYDEMSDFWTDHRSADPMNRNCSIMRAARGGNACIGHYFPDMVSQAIKDARRYLANVRRPPVLRHYE